MSRPLTQRQIDRIPMMDVVFITNCTIGGQSYVKDSMLRTSAAWGRDFIARGVARPAGAGVRVINDAQAQELAQAILKAGPL